MREPDKETSNVHIVNQSPAKTQKYRSFVFLRSIIQSQNSHAQVSSSYINFLSITKMFSSQRLVLVLSAWLLAVAMGQMDTTPSPSSSLSPASGPTAEPSVSAQPSASAQPTGQPTSECDGNSKCAVMGLTGQCWYVVLLLLTIP